MAWSYAVYAWATRGAALPGVGAAMALASSSWVPGIGLMGTFLLLLFPDGRLPSRRWKPWAWFCVVALVVPWIVITFMPGPLDQPPFEHVENPLGIESLRPLLRVLLTSVVFVPLGVVGCAVGLIQRFHRSRGSERLQLKWLAMGAGVCAAIYVLAMTVSVTHGWSTEDTPFWIAVIQNAAFLSFVLIPIAIGIAVLRHRLYDIDLIINRTLVYGALTAVLAFVYVGGVVGVGGLVRQATGQQDNSLVIAATTLVVAALFRPARARIQGFIDRRFYRRNYDAARTVEAFSARLREEVDLETMRVDLLTVVRDTMQPARASLWLRR